MGYVAAHFSTFKERVPKPLAAIDGCCQTYDSAYEMGLRQSDAPHNNW
jgi:hypothetical protein